MKVTTSCYGRFWIFDQAYQLHRLGKLHRLINDYPKFMTRRWGIPDAKVVSLLANGVYGRILRKSFRWLKPHSQSKLMESYHGQFSARLAKYIPVDTDVFIGLSSYSLEAIQRASAKGILTISDHGSLHQRVERRIQIEDGEAWGTSVNGQLPPNWLIEKEDAEFHAADRIMVLSNIAKRSMVEEGIPGDKIFVNPCGVNLSHFKPGLKRDHVFRVIQCGGISQRKGVQYLLQAFTELQLPNSELWFIGGGFEKSNLHSVINRYAADNVHFKGSYPQAELHLLYEQGSVFVLASIADGFGMVVPQAMACALPVIVTDHTGAADIVDEGKNGFVVPARDVRALKEKLLYFYENPNVGRDMGQLAFRSVRTGYTWDDYGDRLVKFLDSLRSSTRARA